jgi:Zn-dependent protease with chaperone function
MARHFKVVLDIAASATLGISGFLSKGLELALYDWERKSELSSDRAGLLCVQNQHAANRSFMKLAAGAPRLYKEMDEDEFIRQIRAYEDATDESFINKAYTALITSYMSHPFIVMRAKHLDSWVQEGNFSDLTGIPLIEVQDDVESISTED